MIDFEEVLYQFGNIHLLSSSITSIEYDNDGVKRAFCKYYTDSGKYTIALRVTKVTDGYKIRIRHAGLVEDLKVDFGIDECMVLSLVEQGYMFIIANRMEQIKNEL